MEAEPDIPTHQVGCCNQSTEPYGVWPFWVNYLTSCSKDILFTGIHMEDLCPASSMKHLNKSYRIFKVMFPFGGKGTDGAVLFSKKVTVTKGFWAEVM